MRIVFFSLIVVYWIVYTRAIASLSVASCHCNECRIFFDITILHDIGVFVIHSASVSITIVIANDIVGGVWTRDAV